MKLPALRKVLREDLGDAPSWVNQILIPLNAFMEAVYQSLNKNITERENIACQIKELTYITPSTYPTMDNVQFMSDLKVKATSCIAVFAVDKATYVPAVGPVYAPWVENDGNIVISPITGLQASKTYIIRLRVS